MALTHLQRDINEQNRYRGRKAAKQDWTIGARVNVGFLRNLEVMSEESGVFTLRSDKGAWYRFEAHQGIVSI